MPFIQLNCEVVLRSFLDLRSFSEEGSVGGHGSESPARLTGGGRTPKRCRVSRRGREAVASPNSTGSRVRGEADPTLGIIKQVR